MESNEIINKIKNIIKQLKQFHCSSIEIKEEKNSEIIKKESSLLTKLVNCFHEILSYNLNFKKEENSRSENNNNYYWNFISKHFNTKVVLFCRQYNKDEKNLENSAIQKGKKWIYFSILEKSFYQSINKIYEEGLDKIYYENSILTKNKSEIIKLSIELNELNFYNIMSKEYEKYLGFNDEVKKSKSNVDIINTETDLKFIESPIYKGRKLSYIQKEKRNAIFSNYCDISIINEIDFLNLGENVDDDKEFSEEDFQIIMPEQCKSDDDEDKKYTFETIAEFPPVNEIFYTFEQNQNKQNNEDQKNYIDKDDDEENNILNIHSLNDLFNIDEKNLNSLNEQNKKNKSEIVLNPKNQKHLPTDNLYEINERTHSEYNANDTLIYNGKRRPITNCLLLYLNKFYKKATYHKFIKHNLKNRPITLKDQNYQCHICLRKIPNCLGIPRESVFWCSYYMRFVCKDCIDNEISIIPHFVLKKWCFDKFTISKKAKHTLELWYDKPTIIFPKNDKIFKKNIHLNKVIKIKKIINIIFDMMKCKDKFKFIEETMGKFNYLALKENIFSLKDLVEINNKIFINKINDYKNKFIQHISGECKDCEYLGEKCNKCCYGEKLFFYNSENVFYCKKCKKSFHKECIGFVGHVH